MTSACPSHEQLIEEGQGLVHSLAVKIMRSIPVRVELGDLIAYGQVGLAEAAKEYDADKGAQFTTFAYYRVRGAIYDGLSKMSWTSRAQYKRMRYQQLANETLRQENEQAKECTQGGTVDADRRWLGKVTEKLAVVYLATNQQGTVGKELSFEDPHQSPPNVAISREIGEKLHDLIDALPTLEKRLIQTTYFEGSTLQDAANRLGISKSWACRLHARTLEQLGRSLRQIGADG